MPGLNVRLTSAISVCYYFPIESIGRKLVSIMQILHSSAVQSIPAVLVLTVPSTNRNRARIRLHQQSPIELAAWRSQITRFYKLFFDSLEFSQNQPVSFFQLVLSAFSDIALSRQQRRRSL